MIAQSTVLFCTGAGPKMGFGHLVRCRSLARAMGVEPLLSVRGSSHDCASPALPGWTPVRVHDDRRLRAMAPALIVVDDPSPGVAAAWVRRARRLDLPIATIHDLGRGHVASDLLIDGSVFHGLGPAGTPSLLGPRFAILDPSIAAARLDRRRPAPLRLLIALGGGAHVHAHAAALSQAVHARVPEAEIRVASGFCPGRKSRLAGGLWIAAPDGLAAEFGAATLAVVAGGVSLYEASALGVPTIGFAVTRAQHLTIRAMACRGAVIDGGGPPVSEVCFERVADVVAAVLRNPRLQERLSSAAAHLVDGLGAARVAERLHRWIDHRAASSRHGGGHAA